MTNMLITNRPRANSLISSAVFPRVKCAYPPDVCC